MNASQVGFLLEEIVAKAVSNLAGLDRNFRENEIRSHFSDPSLNGVDHWISFGNKHILIQDKWKESNTQQEVSQFITCAERIQSRLETTDEVYLIWASKKEPTANSKATLEERHAVIVQCSQSVEALAKCIILQICDTFNIDSTPALQSIPSQKIKPLEGSKRLNPTFQKSIETFDETLEGKNSIEDMKRMIDQIQQESIRKISFAVNMDNVYDVYDIYQSLFPKKNEDWYNGNISKIDYNSFLKTVKTLCWPSSKKKFNSKNLFLYTNLRKLSVRFHTQANDYESKRKKLLDNKSVWAKSLPVLKVNADPISIEEFNNAAKYTSDYSWQNNIVYLNAFYYVF